MCIFVCMCISQWLPFQKRRAKLLSSLSPMHENTITVNYDQKVSELCNFCLLCLLFLLVTSNLYNHSPLYPWWFLKSSLWAPCCASSSLRSSPTLALKRTICPSCSSSLDQSSDDLYRAHSPGLLKLGSNLLLSGRQHLHPHCSCLRSNAVSAIYCILHHYITWHFCKQHVPGSSCPLLLKELLQKQYDCLTERTILSWNVNFSFSLA